MNKKVSKKDDKFIEKFIELYLDIRELEYALVDDKENKYYEKNFNDANKKMNKLLPKYPILFEQDFNGLSKFFNKVVEKKKADIFSREFEFFLKWTFNRLYEEKIINKETYSELKKFVRQLRRPRKGSHLELGGFSA